MNIVKDFPTDVIRQKDVSSLHSFRTPAVSEYFFEVRSTDDLVILSDACAAASERGLPVVFLWAGTNCLFAFDVFHGLIVKNGLTGSKWLSGTEFEVFSAESVHPFSLASVSKPNPFGIQNNALIPWVGLPGTFWGAVVGNAGCFGLETSDILTGAKIWDIKGREFETLDNSDMGFVYRSGVLKNETDRFLVSAEFDLSLRKAGNAYETMEVEAFRELRRSKQPAGRTCGSFFKNPPGQSAGALIDRAGLKGSKIGGASISELHGNFFLADPDAKWQDVVALKDLAIKEVKSRFGIDLEPEARIITAHDPE